MTTACIHPQPATARTCPTCREPMLAVGRDVWICTVARTEARRVSQATRERVRAVAAERVAGLPF